MKRIYILRSIGPDGNNLVASIQVKSEDDVQEAQAIMAEKMADDYIYAEEKDNV